MLHLSRSVAFIARAFLFLSLVGSVDTASVGYAKETPSIINDTPTPGAKSPSAEDCEDLLDQLMPYLTPEKFKAENQDEIARLLTEAQKRGADVGLILEYAGERLKKTKPGYRLSGAYTASALDFTLIKERQPTKDDLRKTTPASDKRLVFRLSDKDKTVTSGGTRNHLDMPTEEDCQELLDRLMVYMTPKKFNARNQDKIAEVFTEAMEGGVTLSTMYMYLYKRLEKTEYGVDYFNNGHTFEISLYKRRTPTKDDLRHAVPVCKEELIFDVSEINNTMKSNGTKRVPATLYKPVPPRP